MAFDGYTGVIPKKDANGGHHQSPVDTSGDTASDPQLIGRVSRAYDRHMGR